MVLCIQSVRFAQASAAHDYTPYVLVSIVDENDAVKRTFQTEAIDAVGGVSAIRHTEKLPLPAREVRVMRTFVKYRLVFEIYHRRVLWKHLRLGAAECKFKEVAEQCEANNSLLIKDENQVVIGELAVVMRVRTPLVLPKCIKRVVIDYLSLPPAPATVSAPTSSLALLAPMAVTTAAAATAAAASNVQEANPAVSASSSLAAPSASSTSSDERAAPASSASAAQPTSSMLAPVEDVQDPFRLDLLCSNNVLDAELASVQRAIAATSDAATVADLQLRLLGVQGKLDVLVSAVQDGRLTLQDYLAELKTQVASQKQLVLDLKRQNRLDDARKVLARVKIMQDEIDTAPADEE